MKPTIEVSKTNETDPGRAWRVTVRLPASITWRGYGIMGQSTDAGPWTEGYGYTPEGAIQAAMVTIGKAVVGMTEFEAEAVATKGGAS